MVLGLGVVPVVRRILQSSLLYYRCPGLRPSGSRPRCPFGLRPAFLDPPSFPALVLTHRSVVLPSDRTATGQPLPLPFGRSLRPYTVGPAVGAGPDATGSAQAVAVRSVSSGAMATNPLAECNVKLRKILFFISGPGHPTKAHVKCHPLPATRRNDTIGQVNGLAGHEREGVIKHQRIHAGHCCGC